MVTTKNALENLIDACMAERGCSRLIAANYAADACLAEYNRIQCDLGSTARSQIVDCAWLNVLLDEHAHNEHVEETGLAPGEDMDGDAASALASAGFGTDEDYEHDTPLGDQYGGE